MTIFVQYCLEKLTCHIPSIEHYNESVTMYRTFSDKPNMMKMIPLYTNDDNNIKRHTMHTIFHDLTLNNTNELYFRFNDGNKITIIMREMGKLNMHSPIYCLNEN